MIVPNTGLKRALFIIDAQPGTFTHDTPRRITPLIARFIAQRPYDAYVVAEFHAPKDSMYFRQHDFYLPLDMAGKTDAPILKALAPFHNDTFHVDKITRSCFKGNDPDGLKSFLIARDIGEIHLTGFDMDDCVLATLYEALDSGYFTFVLEELCHRYDGDEEAVQAALTVFRESNMTNNSLTDKINRSRVAL